MVLLTGDVSGQTRRGRIGSRRPARPKAATKTEASPSKAAKTEVNPNAARQPTAITTPSGLTYLITQRGEGRQPKPGEFVLVHYTGLLTDGTVFDSSRNRGKPFGFSLGAGRVIKGWDEGVAQLRVGDRAMLIIPPQLGYGSRGAGGVIPPDATLIFVIDLVDVKEKEPSDNPLLPPGQ